jgi:hypothetical protein
MTHDSTKSAYDHPLLPFGASFARKLASKSSTSATKFTVAPKLHGFNAECEPRPEDAHFSDAQGKPLTPGVSVCFAGDILEAVETETLVFLRELIETFPVLVNKRFYIVAVPMLLSPSKFLATGNYIKQVDIDEALRECGFANRQLNGQNEQLLVLPLYLPHEVSQRTPERRIHLASRTATFCGNSFCKTALSTPDDYAVWQVTRALMALAGMDLSQAPAVGGTTLLDRSGRAAVLQNWTMGESKHASGINALVQRDPISETAIKVGMEQFSGWQGFLRNTLTKDKNASDDALTDALTEEIWGDDGSKAERENVMRRAMEKVETLHDEEAVADVLFDAVSKVRASLAKRSSPERRDHARIVARLTVDVAKILPRTVALARREYDYDGIIESASILWAEGKASARFA